MRLGFATVHAVVCQLRLIGVQYIIAPYEADAQLAYLACKGLIWAASTVDSDFIVHGVERIFYVVDYTTGRCDFVDLKLLLCPQRWTLVPAQYTDFLQLLKVHGAGFLTCYALCAGCDYDTKLPSVGPMSALKCIKLVAARLSGLSDLRLVIPALSHELSRFSAGMDVDSWQVKASNAVICFTSSLVYCPKQRVVMSRTGEACETASASSPFLGLAVLDADAERRALGFLSPDGKEHDLPAVSQVAGPVIPCRLTPEMIAGAQLKPHTQWSATYPTIKDMLRFMKTRHEFSGVALSSKTRAELLVVVKKRLEVEDLAR
jgi:exonuclease-1